jgi:hypothetical protein
MKTSETTTNDETFDETIRDLLGVSKSFCDTSWNTYVQNHIEPDRLVELGFDISAPNNRERSHFASCAKCANRLIEISANFCKSDNHGTEQSATQYASGQLELWNCSSEEDRHDDVRPLAVLPTPDNVPALLREHLQFHGPVLFPNEEIAFVSWQFGRLLQPDIDSEAASSIVGLIAEEATSLIQRIVQSSRVVIVCFGRAMHVCGVRIATCLRERGYQDPHVILAHDFYSPSLVCDPREFAKAEVIVLVDVVRTGDLLQRMVAACIRYRPKRILGLAIIDQSDGFETDVRFLSLWKESKEQRIDQDDPRAIGLRADDSSLRRFDANDEYATIKPTHSSEPQGIRTDAAKMPELDEDLVECIYESGAFKRDYRIGKKLYPYVVNVLDLLKIPSSQYFIVSKVKEVLADITKGRTCLVYHAGRSRRAGKVARLLASHLDLPVFKIGTTGPSFSLSDAQFKVLACYDNVVVVDAAIRTGETIAAVTRAVDDKWLRKHTRFIALGILDALSHRSRQDLAEELDIEIRTLFTLPLAPPTEQVRHWANSRKAAIRQLLVDTGGFESVRKILGTYCDPRPARRSVTATPETLKETEHAIRRVSQESRSFDLAFGNVSEACRVNHPSLIRHISIDEAIRDSRVQSLLVGVLYNSMKPSFKESAVFALAAAGNYGWMNLDWLKCNRMFLGSKNECWKSIAVVQCQMKLENRDAELTKFRDALLTYRQLSGTVAKLKHRHEQDQIRLFDEDTQITQSADTGHRILSRIDALIAVAESPAPRPSSRDKLQSIVSNQ